MQSMRCSRDAILVLPAPITSAAARRACVSSGTPVLIDVRPTAMEGSLGGYFGAVATQGWTTNGMNL